jgi:hypothetical protein
VLGIKINELLSALLGKTELFEQGSDLIGYTFVELIALREGEVGVLRRSFLLYRSFSFVQ